MFYVGKPRDKHFQLAGVGLSIHSRGDEVTFKPGEDFAVQAAPVLLSAFLEFAVQILRNILQSEGQHCMEP